MELFGLFIPLHFIILGAFSVFFVFGCWTLSSDGHERRDPKKNWYPDADPVKAETIRNHIPGGLDR